ncbi:MAG: ankyrin repeat domain-containing protein [Alphaproteobacteria bacterium]|nr:ankyrin repeat domain-containing protein [Alphaproteobacteria bacterium]
MEPSLDTIFHSSINSRDWDEAIRIVKRNPEGVNWNDPVLMDSALRKNAPFDLVKLMVEAGALINSNARPFTPLILAIFKNDEDMVDLFISNGADLHQRDWNIQYPLTYAIYRNNPNLVRRIIKADKSVVNYHGTGILINSIEQKMPLDVIELMIKAGAPVNVKFDDNYHHPEKFLSPIIAADLYDRQDVIELLVRNGAAVQTKDSNLKDVILNAMSRGCVETVTRIIAAHKNIVNNYDSEIFTRAFVTGMPLDVIQQIIDPALLVTFQHEIFASIIEKADRHSRQDVIELLMRNVIEKGIPLDVIKAMIEAGLPVTFNYQDFHYRPAKFTSPIMIADRCGRGDVVDLLISRGADVHQEDSDGKDALTNAIDLRHVETINKLIVAGSNVNKIDKNGHNRLYEAWGLKTQEDVADIFFREGYQEEFACTQNGSDLFCFTKFLLEETALTVAILFCSKVISFAYNFIPASILMPSFFFSWLSVFSSGIALFSSTVALSFLIPTLFLWSPESIYHFIPEKVQYSDGTPIKLDPSSVNPYKIGTEAQEFNRLNDSHKFVQMSLPNQDIIETIVEGEVVDWES